MNFPNVLINDIPVKMEIDSGDGMSCMPFSVFMKHFSHVPLSSTSIKLKTYGGFILISECVVSMIVKFEEVGKLCTILVVKNVLKI